MITWLLQTTSDCNVPAEHWLTLAERECLAALKTEKRRREWLLGRWTAKQLLRACIAEATGKLLPLTAVNVSNDADGVPFGVWDSNFGLSDLPLSISHRDQHALCAVAEANTPAIGADIERIEPRSQNFVEDYFTDIEVMLVDHTPLAEHDTVITAIWSAKEAALKAWHLGLSVDTRWVECRIDPLEMAHNDWSPFSICRIKRYWKDNCVPLMGWWQVQGDYVLTLAAASTPTQGLRQLQKLAFPRNLLPDQPRIELFDFVFSEPHNPSVRAVA